MSTDNFEALPMAAGYERSRFNAVRHGILSRHLVLPWEDGTEYEDLMDSLVAEHRSNGPTEHHLVEELAGVIWRKQRLTLAEASAHRAGHLGEGERTGSAAAIGATPEVTEAGNSRAVLPGVPAPP